MTHQMYIAYTKAERKRCFEQGYKDYPTNKNPHQQYGFRSKEYNKGFNYREGLSDYPENKCSYKKGSNGYKAYMCGFNFATRPQKVIK